MISLLGRVCEIGFEFPMISFITSQVFLTLFLYLSKGSNRRNNILVQYSQTNIVPIIFAKYTNNNFIKNIAQLQYCFIIFIHIHAAIISINIK